MSDITLSTISTLDRLSSINNNFDTIESVINNQMVHSVGGNNVMSQDLDMNSRRILNLPAPVNPNDPVRFQDIQDVVAEGFASANLISYTPAGTGAEVTTVEAKLRESVSVKDFGAVGDGVTDDTAAVQAAIDSVSILYNGTGNAKKIFFPSGKYRITSTIEVPPGVFLEGEALFPVTSLVPGSVIVVDFDGTGVRFVRRNASPGNLFHNGGMRLLAFNGTSGGAGSNVKLVELGDSGNVSTSTGAWNGHITHCVFNFATTGYGIYSAHSQEWFIQHCMFRNVKHAIHFPTVMASSRIISCTFLDENTISGSSAITGEQGALGGSMGCSIKDNYIYGYQTGVYLAGIRAAQIRDNVLEGIRGVAVTLSTVTFSGTVLGTAESVLPTHCIIDGNTFINWSSGGAFPAIRLYNSRFNTVGRNGFRAPASTATCAVDLVETSSELTSSNEIYYPAITGANSGTVPPILDSNSLWTNNKINGADRWKLRNNTSLPSTATWSTANDGTMSLSQGHLYLYDNTQGGWSRIPRISKTTLDVSATSIDARNRTLIRAQHSSPTTITSITNGIDGQTITIYATTTNTTIQDGAGIQLRGNTNTTMTIYQSITLMYSDSDATWFEVARSY